MQMAMEWWMTNDRKKNVYLKTINSFFMNVIGPHQKKEKNENSQLFAVIEF